MVGLSRVAHLMRLSVGDLCLWLNSQCQTLQREHSIQFHVNVAEELAHHDVSPQLLRELDSVLKSAAQTVDHGGSVEIGAHLTRRGLEVEIVAQDNLNHHEEGLCAFSRQNTTMSGGYALTSYRARCPDGSMAWIVVQSDAPKIRLSA